jgi:hypothetical protein
MRQYGRACSGSLPELERHCQAGMRRVAFAPKAVGNEDVETPEQRDHLVRYCIEVSGVADGLPVRFEAEGRAVHLPVRHFA